MKKIIVFASFLIAAILTLTGCKQRLTNNIYETDSEIESITLIEVIGDVKIEKSDSDTLLFSYYEIKDAYYFTINNNEDTKTLTITRKDNRTSFQKGEFASKNSLTLYVPESMIPEINVSVNTGNIDVSSVKTGKLSLTTVVGNISVSSTESKATLLEANVGNISYYESKCESLNYKNTRSGNSNIEEVSVEGAIEADINYGSAIINDVKAGFIVYKALNSDVDFSKIDIETRLSVTVTTGNINLSLKGRENEFSVTAKSSTDPQSGISTNLGEKEVKLNTTVGKISVEYTR